MSGIEILILIIVVAAFLIYLFHAGADEVEGNGAFSGNDGPQRGQAGRSVRTCPRCERTERQVPIQEGVTICQPCIRQVLPEVQRKMDIVAESQQLVNESKHIDTRLSRCGVVLDTLEDLRPFVDWGMIAVPPSLDETMASFRDVKAEIVEEHLQEYAAKSARKAQTYKSTSAKTKRYDKVIEEILKYAEFLPSEVVEDHIEKTEEAKHKVELDDYVEKARKAEFKGKSKKAIDQYQEALYFLRTDQFDDEEQADIISSLEVKIEKLGGHVPNEWPAPKGEN